MKDIDGEKLNLCRRENSPRRLTCGAVILAAVVSASGCTLLGPGFAERDHYVINTPKYYDNRVFYVDPYPTGHIWKLQDAVGARTDDNDKSRIVHGSPLSIILNGVSLPQGEGARAWGENSRRARDIAVVIDLSTKVTGSNQSIVAWYQRGVQPDQALNFSNLLIYFEPLWDARVAPLIRIRVVDVTSEKNAQVREALGQVKQFTESVGPILSNSTQAIASVASNAATLLLTRSNEQLLDYSVQFYSEEQLAESYGSDLTPLKRGRVLLIGRPIGKPSTYWRGFEGTYDGETLSVFDKGEPVESPDVLLTISTAQAIVPTIVSTRSAYLQKLLSDAQQSDTTAVEEAGHSVWSGARTYALLESLRRSRDSYSLVAVHDAYIVDDQDDKDNALDAQDKALLRQTLREISGCSLGTDTEFSDWWDKNKDNISFEKDSFKLVNHTCGP